MITNLPIYMNGAMYPFPALERDLRRGMCFELHSNGGVIRRGVVFLEPSLTPHYMWWHTKTRFVNGEVPICHALLDEIPIARRETLSVHIVPNFNDFFARVPYAIKTLLGHTRAILRDHHVRGATNTIPVALPETLPAPSTLSDGNNDSSRQADRQLQTVVPQTFLPAAVRNEIPILDPPCEIPSFALLPKVRKPRCDKGTKRGGHDAGGHQEGGGILNSREMNLQSFTPVTNSLQSSAPVHDLPPVLPQVERLQGQLDLITRVFQAVSKCFNDESPSL